MFNVYKIYFPMLLTSCLLSPHMSQSRFWNITGIILFELLFWNHFLFFFLLSTHSQDPNFSLSTFYDSFSLYQINMLPGFLLDVSRNQGRISHPPTSWTDMEFSSKVRIVGMDDFPSLLYIILFASCIYVNV